jgi:hypothetical protein
MDILKGINYQIQVSKYWFTYDSKSLHNFNDSFMLTLLNVLCTELNWLLIAPTHCHQMDNIFCQVVESMMGWTANSDT